MVVTIKPENQNEFRIYNNTNLPVISHLCNIPLTPLYFNIRCYYGDLRPKIRYTNSTVMAIQRSLTFVKILLQYLYTKLVVETWCLMTQTLDTLRRPRRQQESKRKTYTKNYWKITFLYNSINNMHNKLQI